jgi:zinc protease
MKGLTRKICLSAVFLALLTLPRQPAQLTADERARKPGTEDPAVQAAAALYEGIRTETLPNGLQVYLKPIPESPVVATMVAYRVGSADENLDHTGLSHYLEHLMFKGTEKLLPGDIDRLTLRNGGQNNAYTSEDYTVFHFDFAADRWEAALEVEADRMRNLRIDTRHEFEQEKGAVIAELERNQDEPWDLETKAILPLLFDEGPYGHPIIGKRRHVREATAAVIKAHYDTWYYPNNASLVVCGGFDPERALARIRELFGPLPKGELPARKKAQASKRTEPVLKEIPSKFESPRLLMGFNTVRSGAPDFYPLEVVQALLTGGKTGRLYKRLVEQERLAAATDTTNYGGRFPGWFEIRVDCFKGVDRQRVERIVMEELQKLRDEPVGTAELLRVRRGVIANAIFGRESVHGLADSIARGVTTNDLAFLKSYLPRLEAVSAREAQAAAQKYFDPQQRVVVWSLPEIADREAVPAPEGRRPARPRPPNRKPPGRHDAGGEGRLLALTDAQRVELPNGLVLLLLENHRLPIVVAGAALRWSTLLEPEEQAGVAALAGSLLDEGTARHTGQQIAEQIEDVGGSLSVSGAGGTVKVLAPDRARGLGLLLECLGEATFPADAFARKKAQQLAAIDDAEHQPELRAERVYHRLVYGKHPFGRPALGRRETIEPLTRQDCLAFYRKAFVPNNLFLAVVGDFDSQEVIADVKRLTAGWKKTGLHKPDLPEVKKPAGFQERIITMPGAAQLQFYMGHPGIRRDNPDYYKLLVMDYVLGTGSGFTDRLSARLRDREGLAYEVSATITSTAGEEPGLFTCYVGTAPQFLPRVKQEFLEELNRIREERPADEEVADAKKFLLGSLPFQLATNDRVAAMLLTVERHQLGLHYLDEYRKAVAAVTPEDVQAVARKYLDPKHMVLVAAGAVDDNGRPLVPLPPPKQP